MLHRQFFICFCLFILIALSAQAFPPSSPAGGNYLVLDGVDDYAVLDFEASGILLPEGTDDFTVEAWVYPTKHPARCHTNEKTHHNMGKYEAIARIDYNTSDRKRMRYWDRFTSIYRASDIQ